MSPLVVFALAGAGTYLARSVFIIAVGDRPLHPRIARFLKNIGPAVLASLTASLLTAERLPEFVTSAPELVGVAVGVAVAIWRRHLVWTFVAGLAAWMVVGLFT